MGGIKSRRPWALGAFILALLSGCSVLNIDVQPDAAVTTAYLADPSLDNAINYANELRSEYFNKVNIDAELTTGSGLALIPIGALALFYGISGASKDVPLALGIGGAGLYTGASFLHSQPRQLIYAAGANAVTCAIAIMDPLSLSSAEWSAFQADILALVRDTSALRQALNPFVDRVGPEIDYAKTVLARAEATIDQANRTNAAIAQAGRTLFNSVQMIRGLVNRAIISNQPNLDVLMASLGGALPLRAAQIAPGISGRLPKGAGVFHALPNELEAAAQLQVAVQNAEVSIARVKLVIDRIGPGPSADTLKACTNGISGAALPFTVLPTTDLQFAAKATTVQTAAIVLSGGQSPYSSNFVGVLPGKAVSAALTYDSGGAGIITVTVPPDAESGDYTLSVADKSGTSKSVGIHITAVRSSTKSTSNENQRAANVNSKTQVIPAALANQIAIRDQLVQRGCQIDPNTTSISEIGKAMEQFVAKHPEYGEKQVKASDFLMRLQQEKDKKC
jgi:hypothetical protein